MRATATKLFRFAPGKDIITLFHKPSLSASKRVETLLKQISANAGSDATIDEASAQASPGQTRRDEFDLDVTEAAPTPDQLRNIIDYLGGPSHVSKVIQGANSAEDAIKKLSANGDAFQRPVVVDWNNGKAVAGDNQSEILNMLGAPNHK